MKKSYWNYIILLLFLPICYSQTGISITEPKLISIIPINSSALNVTWQFADTTYDQSDIIRISIDFYEFFYNYGPINTSRNYIFTPTNKTITYLIEKFELVNAFYYVCFSTNSTYTNTSLSLATQTCQLKQTCQRLNSTLCPQTGFIRISSSDITSNSFIINIHWLKNLPYTRSLTVVQLASNGVTGTALNPTENTTYYTQPYRFSSLQSQTNYDVNIVVNYTIFDRSLADSMSYVVTTSHSSTFYLSGDMWIFIIWSVLLSFLFS